MRIIVKGNRGYGIDYGVCNIFSNIETYIVSVQDLGNTLYNILNNPPFEDCIIQVEYNTDTSAHNLKLL